MNVTRTLFFLHRSVRIRHLSVFLLITLWLGSCTLQDHPPTSSSYLISSNLIGEFSKTDLTPRLAALGLPPAYATLIQYDIKVYKLVYRTTNPDGKSVQASGALIVPKTANPVSLISQQHGTILTDAQAPSNYAPGSEAYSFASVFASNGFLIACPDYIGYGASANLPHTYELRTGLAQASLDMLRASREFIQKDNSIQWDTRLYLSGYSEGGFATMSLYKKLQDEFPSEFNLRAVTAGAGAYDKTNFMIELLTKPSHGNADYNRTYLWVLLTYDRFYGLNRPLETYFVEPYLTEIKTKGLAATLNVSFEQIFTASFKQGILSRTDKAFLEAVADNNIYNWKPLRPLQLYHGTADPQVFFLNSQNAYAAMTANGAGATVQLIPIPNGTHQSSLPTYILGTYTFFTTIK